MKPYIVISSCLLGLPTRWDGESLSDNSKLSELVKIGKALPLCPEQLGGLSTPREPAEIEFGKTSRDVLDGCAKITTYRGQDVTFQFIKGAETVLSFCQKFDIKVAILKSRSPSCGSCSVYDGSFEGSVKKGKGVTAELLSQNGIEIFNEKNFPKDL